MVDWPRRTTVAYLGDTYLFVRLLAALALLSSLAFAALAQSSTSTSGNATAMPADARAQKSYSEGVEYEKSHQWGFALEAYKKADKQDGNRCAACARKVVDVAIDLENWKSADAASTELLALAATPDEQAASHLDRAKLLIAMGKAKKKPECFAEGQKETQAALALHPEDRPAMYLKGVCLAEQQQDDAAKQVFTELAPRLKPGSVDYGRVARYAERPELVRARMAPPFSVTTLDGKRISLDDLKDKVVLIDFWATWCGPCREALPHMKDIAKEFAGQPLVVLSVSLDGDEAKWKDFVAKNNMTWLQYRDGGFNGPVAQEFGVNAIPHTFTIDSDGVLQDEHVGDAEIDGKLKKLVARTRARQEAVPQVASASGSH